MTRWIGCGLLSACLLISGCGGGGGGSHSSGVQNSNTTPVAEAGSIQNVKTGALVTLDGSASHDADGDTLTYSWRFTIQPDNSTATLDTPDTPKPHFTADVAGQYVLELVVNDGQTDSDAATVSVTATRQNSAPVADAGADQTVTTGGKVTLDGRDSSDADGDTLTYRWSFASKPTGSQANLAKADSVQASFTPDVDGNYRLDLIVNDGLVDSSADAVLVTASTANSAPVADAGSDQSVTAGDTVTLDGSASRDADGDALVYHWAFVSKPGSSSATLTDADSVSPSFVADVAGDYVAALTVNDGRADSAADNVAISAAPANAAPVADAGKDQSVNAGDTVSLDGSASHDADGDLLTYQWQFVSRPAGSRASLSDAQAAAPAFVADLPGQYVIGLVVNDGQADSSGARVTVTAAEVNAAPTADAGADQAVVAGTTVTLNGGNSKDADGDTLAYHWQFVSKPSGSSATLTGADAVSPQFHADVVGSYVVELVVDDGQAQSAPDRVTITASQANSVPVADAGVNQAVTAGTTVTLDSSGSLDADGDLLTYQWQFVSKPSGSAATLSDGTIAAPTFSADLPGDYVVSLIVNDGRSSSTASQVLISATANEYTLTYTAGLGGSINGDAYQIIRQGESGTTVTASPDTGFSFTKWSDGLATASRTDKDVQGNLDVSARFESSLSSPKILTIEPGSHQVTVSWSRVEGATAYNLYYATEDGINKNNYLTLSGGTKKSGAQSPLLITGLSNGSTYYLVVTATRAASESKESEETSATPIAPVIPWEQAINKGSLEVKIDGPRKATAVWQDDGTSDYRLYITDDASTDLNNYASFGATLINNARTGHALEELSTNKPYYIALEKDGQLVAWTRFRTGVWGVNGTVNAQAISDDGTRYVGGFFTYAGQPVGGAEAFTSGTSAQPLGMPRIDGIVNTIASDGSGGWFIGGSFSAVDEHERAGLAHIDHRGLLTDWSPTADGSVFAIAVDQDTVYIGGDFHKINNEERNGLASLTRSGTLTSWSPDTNGSVEAMVIGNNKIYVGGLFTSINGMSRARIAAFASNGTLSSWNPGSDASVDALTVEGEMLYLGGSFRMLDGVSRSGLAAFDSAGQLTSWAPKVNGRALALLGRDGKIYVGGTFTEANDIERNHVASFDELGILTPWNPNADNHVYSLSSSESTIYIGGAFQNVGGMEQPHIAALSLTGQLNDWQARPDGTVFALLAQGDMVYVGGKISVISLLPRSRLVAFDHSGNITDWQPDVDGPVNAIAIGNSEIYIGGEFESVNSLSRRNLASIDPTGNVTEWYPTTDDVVQILLYSDDIVYAEGPFTSANNINRKNLAAFDTQGTLTSWSPAVNFSVSTMIEHDGIFYLGGDFTKVGNADRNYLAAFDKSGHLTSWNPEVDGQVQALAVKNDIIYAGGWFSYARSEERPGLAAFDLAGDVTEWNPSLGQTVKALAISDSAIYAGGYFVTAGGTKRLGLASFDFDGDLTDWAPQPNEGVYSLIERDGEIYIGGYFTSVSGSLRSRIARINEAGELLDQ